MEFDEKELRKEISYAIKNIHGVRQVEQTYCCSHLPYLFPCLSAVFLVYLCLFSFIKTCSTVFVLFFLSPVNVLASLSGILLSLFAFICAQCLCSACWPYVCLPLHFFPFRYSSFGLLSLSYCSCLP